MALFKKHTDETPGAVDAAAQTAVAQTPAQGETRAEAAEPEPAIAAGVESGPAEMPGPEPAEASGVAGVKPVDAAGEYRGSRAGRAAKSAAKKPRFGKKRATKKGVVRIEELQEALGEAGEDVDPEAIVSMYLPKRRMHRIGAALLRMGTLQKVLLCLALVLGVLFSLSFMQENMGNFTINLNRLELFRHGVAIADNAEFQGATARLAAEAVSNGTNIAAEDLPSDLDEVDGSHNGKNYVAYTFYIRNAGKEDLHYSAKLKIASASKGVEKAARVRVWRNGEPTTYAAAAADGGIEAGADANFESDEVVCDIANDDFKVGYVDKYTVVIWLDGDDPECIDNIVGGAVEFAMDFDADDENQTSLLMKFVQDIADTLTGQDPISASGNDAPDYYQNREVTWDDRRNQENPPAGE